MTDVPAVARGQVWTDAQGCNRFVCCVSESRSGKMIEFRTGHFRPVMRLALDKFVADCQFNQEATEKAKQDLEQTGI